MKILVVSNMYPNKKYPSYGTFVKSFCDQLKTLGIDYDISVMYKSSNKISKIFRYFYFYIVTFLKCLIKNYDIVYIHYASHSSVPVILAKKINKSIKIYTNVHGSDVVPENTEQQKMQKYTKKILKDSNKIIVPSDYFKDYVSLKYNIKPDKIFIYPSGGVNSKVFYPFKNSSNDSFINDLNLNPNFPTFAMISRISFKKGWNIFIKAINICVRDGVKANFLIVGDGPEKDQMTNLIKENKLESTIKILGLQDQMELSRIYNAVDYLVFPTMREGESLGLVAIEALACGCPVIASNYAAPKHYIKDDFNGFKFPKGDYKKLAEVIEECIQIKKDKYAFLSSNALVSASPYLKSNISSRLKDIIYY